MPNIITQRITKILKYNYNNLTYSSIINHKIDEKTNFDRLHLVIAQIIKNIIILYIEAPSSSFPQAITFYHGIVN